MTSRLADLWRSITRPTPTPEASPDYQLIVRLGRKLGIDQPPTPQHTTRRRPPAVCLRKDCDGHTDDVHTASGQLVARIHHCA